jgi:predicted nucleic acid-binding protein
MILLDTDMLTLLLRGNPRVQRRMHSAETDVATTVITWMEVMQGRFQAIFTAADADQLELASRRLEESVRQFSTLPIVPWPNSSQRCRPTKSSNESVAATC